MTNEGSSNKIFRMIHAHTYIYTCAFKNKRIDKKLRYRYIVNFIFNNNNTRCASILKKLSKCLEKNYFSNVKRIMNLSTVRIRGQQSIDSDINNVIRRTFESLYVSHAHKDKWGSRFRDVEE